MRNEVNCGPATKNYVSIWTGTGFNEASAIAVDALIPLLDVLGLTRYPLTSGGRGAHIFVRIKTDSDFIGVRAGIALAREVERISRRDDDVVVERGAWKADLIDYNQNARDHT